MTTDEERAARTVLEYVHEAYSCCGECGKHAVTKARRLIMRNGTVDDLTRDIIKCIVNTAGVVEIRVAQEDTHD